MQRWLTLLLCLGLFSCSPRPVSEILRPLPTATASELPVADAAGQIKMVSEEYPPYTFTNPAGKFVGLATDKVLKVITPLGLPYTLQSYPWARSYRMALSEPNVLIFLLTYSPDRAKDFKWIYPLYPTNIYLYALKNRTDIQIKTLEDAKKYRIGIIDGYHDGAYLISQGFIPGEHLEVSSTPEILMEKFFNNRFDLALLENVYALYTLRQYGYNPDQVIEIYQIQELTRWMCIAASQGTSDALVDKIQAAFEAEYGRVDMPWSKKP